MQQNLSFLEDNLFVFLVQKLQNLDETGENNKYKIPRTSHQTHSVLWKDISDIGMEFKCDQCDFKYKSKGKLNRHHAAKHQMKRYPCAQCDAEYTRRDTLLSHVRDKHEGKTIKCNSCDFQTGVYGGSQKMAAHRRVEHGEQSLKCGMCEFETYYAPKLGYHKKRVHNGSEKKDLIATNVIIVVTIGMI